MDVLLNNIPKESSRHAQEENCKAESPFGSAFGKTDVVSDLLAENRPTVNCTNTSVIIVRVLQLVPICSLKDFS